MSTRFFGVVLAVVAGCAGDDEPKTTDSGSPDTGTESTAPGMTTEGLAIVGEWTDDFGTAHVITQTEWTQTYPGGDPLGFRITRWGDDWLVAQNDAANAYFPDAWSRFDWAWDGDALLVCQSVYDAADEATALAATPADTTDPTAGCGGFPFSVLTPAGG